MIGAIGAIPIPLDVLLYIVGFAVIVSLIVWYELSHPYDPTKHRSKWLDDLMDEERARQETGDDTWTR